jgi:hypothetical protein
LKKFLVCLLTILFLVGISSPAVSHDNPGKGKGHDKYDGAGDGTGKGKGKGHDKDGGNDPGPGTDSNDDNDDGPVRHDYPGHVDDICYKPYGKIKEWCEKYLND